jgi:hypothetical protein
MSFPDRRMMGRFHRFLNECDLKDIYRHGRRYTWSNERDRPTLVRLDRVLFASPPRRLDHCLLLLDLHPLAAVAETVPL